MQQRVSAGPDAGTRTAAHATTGTTEEGVHDVGEPAEGTGGAAHAAATRRERVAAEVDDLALLRVGQHFVRRGDLFEPVLRLGRRVHVRMQLAGELAIGLLDLVRGRVAGDTEQPVVVAGWHEIQPSARIWPT